MRLAKIVMAAVFVLFMAQVASWAEEMKPADASSSNADAQQQQQMMQQMMELGQPNEHHEALKPMAGTFAAESTVWMNPNGEPEKSTGETVNQMVLGGRFLHSLYNGTAMGQPFQGVGVMGYDNQKQKYVSFWTDTMSTGFMIAQGTADESGKVFTLSCSFDCPMDNTQHTMRQVTTIVDDDHYTYEAWDIAPDGKENKVIEIHFTRKG